MPRLTELKASFIRWAPIGFRFVGADAHGANGIWFLCPTPGHSHAIILWFENPLDCDPVPKEVAYNRWQRIGSTIDELTLAPSINIRDDWHGFVLNGVVS